MEANFKPISQVQIKSSIYQGDALSPLLFWTLSARSLQKLAIDADYEMGATISHLL